jgi:DNA-binding HxlR family transcriptional regulator
MKRVLQNCLRSKICFYGDFTKSEEKIATNILANRLQTLEDKGIIIKLPYPDNKVKVLYSLSPKGVELIPALIEIALWGDNI